jgi:hypothetical protein
MKRCPACNRIEADNSLAFGRADGKALVSDPSPLGSEEGAKRSLYGRSSKAKTSSSSELVAQIKPLRRRRGSLLLREALVDSYVSSAVM